MNTAHHSLRRAETSRSSPMRSQSSVSARLGVGDRLGALALERVARGAAAEHDRREEQADLVDLAGVEERAGQVRAALEQDRADARRRRAGRARSARAPARSRRWRRSPRRRAPRARRWRRAARRARRRRSAGSRARVGDELGVAAAAAPVESNTTRRGWRATPSTRAVSCGSSASAVPMPTATASHSARQRCAEPAARLAGDPLRVAGARWRPCRRASSPT